MASANHILSRRAGNEGKDQGRGIFHVFTVPSVIEDEEDKKIQLAANAIFDYFGYISITEVCKRNDGRSIYLGTTTTFLKRALKIKFLNEINMIDMETECMYRLGKHPNIVKLYQCAVVARFSCMALEYQWAEEGDVLEYAKRVGISRQVARDLFCQTLRAVKYAHNNAICHRDIKLENLFLLKTSPIRVVLGDWGFATFYARGKKKLKRSCGSIHYASPEILLGEEYEGPEVDAWSLGVLLCALVTTCFPFNGDTLPEIAMHVIQGEPEINFFEEDAHDGELVDLIMGLLEKKPSQRYTVKEAFLHPWLQKAGKCARLSKLKRENAPLTGSSIRRSRGEMSLRHYVDDKSASEVATKAEISRASTILYVEANNLKEKGGESTPSEWSLVNARKNSARRTLQEDCEQQMEAIESTTVSDSELLDTVYSCVDTDWSKPFSLTSGSEIAASASEPVNTKAREDDSYGWRKGNPRRVNSFMRIIRRLSPRNKKQKQKKEKI